MLYDECQIRYAEESITFFLAVFLAAFLAVFSAAFSAAFFRQCITIVFLDALPSRRSIANELSLIHI